MEATSTESERKYRRIVRETKRKEPKGTLKGNSEQRGQFLEQLSVVPDLRLRVPHGIYIYSKRRGVAPVSSLRIPTWYKFE